jgi:hypothetical protein
VQDKSGKPHKPEMPPGTPTSTVHIAGTPTVHLTRANLGSIAPALVRDPITVSTTTPSGTPPTGPHEKPTLPPTGTPVPVVVTGTATPLPVALTGTGGAKALQVQAQQSGHWTVDIGKFDFTAVVEMFATGVAVSIATSLGRLFLPRFTDAWKRMLQMGEEEDRNGPPGGGASKTDADLAKKP